MVSNNVVLSAALRSTLYSLNRTQGTIDVITERLATGQDVNSAIDDPDNFFTARALRNTASDQSRLLDGIGQSIRVLQEGISGLQAVENLINQAEAIAQTSRDFLEAGDVDPAVFEETVDTSPPSLSTQINAAAPDVYFRLNETAGPIIDSGAAGAGVGANYLGGATAGAAGLYTNGTAPSVDFDGVNDRIQVNDSPLINTTTTTARTVELVFQADDVTGRQVLYEEGAGVNGFTIYLDGDTLYVTGEDDQGGQRWADANINSTALGVQIQTGQTYHAAFVYDSATDSFSGYLDGVLMGAVGTAGASNFPSHSGNIGIGAAVDGVQFHDGEAGAGFRFDGRISDVAIYNRAVSDTELASHANSLNSSTSLVYLNQEYNTILDQIDRLVIDAHYRGINLLAGENLQTNFNAEGSSFLLTEGQSFSASGLGLVQRNNFNDLTDVNNILDAVRDAREVVRGFAFTLTNDLSIIETRDTFTRENINTNLSGADDLTLSDANRDGADLLATQTRQALGVTALNLAAQSQFSTIRLF